MYKAAKNDGCFRDHVCCVNVIVILLNAIKQVTGENMNSFQCCVILYFNVP